MTLSKQLRDKFITIGKESKESKESPVEKIHKTLTEKKFTDESLSTNYSEVKKIMKDLGFSKNILSEIKAPKEVYERITKKYKKSLSNREEVLITSEILEKIIKKKDGDLADRAIYLLTVSGRRTKELITAEFKIKKRSGNLIHVDGFVQKKETAQGSGYITPLIPKRDFLNSARQFQKDFNNGNIKSFERTLLRRVKSIDPKLKPHSLRGIYALLMYNFKNTNNKSRTAFTTEVLNHSKDISSLSYMAFKLDPSLSELGSEFNF